LIIEVFRGFKVRIRSFGVKTRINVGVEAGMATGCVMAAGAVVCDRRGV
jgi:hypothetical protein